MPVTLTKLKARFPETQPPFIPLNSDDQIADQRYRVERGFLRDDVFEPLVMRYFYALEDRRLAARLNA